ncbi:protein kinase domain containing protein [Acanthamoeba castellanii str. Neff]|uniref:Protein kinase domain containing protein n=1 Tax=Acanthamoeba castellanii (strain ATCC 30010 / Neff) TaxID=1257118 RepID=L8H966_ACACF|nr:protein kinase domain containing protein [Acanthamoeba castellanii str. Neff]ELR21777.1 protein kinase domain containing protein [Acanthamoeba castellanii str. Neff]
MTEDLRRIEAKRRGIVQWEPGQTLIKASELSYDREIARGNYGTVYKGRCRGFPVAIKLLHNQHLIEPKIEELKREVEIMSSLRHPCILLFMGVCTEKDNLAVVMEYVDGRDLESIVHDKDVVMTTAQQLLIAKGIAQGMNWLHCLKPEPIIHRDLKPPNVLVTKDFEVRVCDFGLSCVKEKFDPKAPPKDKAVGTPVWMSPEILCGLPASEKSDVYAFGLVLWELFTRKERPFAHVTSFSEFCDDVIDRNVRPTLPDEVPKHIRRLIKACWHGDMDKRPSFEQILEKIDELVVTNSIKDKVARNLWKILKETETASHYPFYAEWDNFIEVLCGALGLPLDTIPPESTIYQCAKAILAEEERDLTSSDAAKKFLVSCESFGRFVDVFGPLRSDILSNFDELCRTGCFHGSIDAKEAERRLTGQRSGCYLVRLSSKDNCIAITKRHKHGFNHQRAFRNEKGFNIQIGTKCHLFPSLLAFLNSPQARSKKDGLYLKCPCFTDSKFAQIHKKGAEEREVSYVGLDYIREGLRNAKVSSSSNIYGSSTNNNNGNSDNHHHHHHHDGGGHAPTISSHSASNSNLVSHSPIYGSEPQVVVEEEKIRKKKKRLSWRKSKNYE